jgi:putative SOS response-associated peptidase YedK
MCGRYTLTSDINAVAQAFNVATPSSLHITPRYNIAPTQEVVTILRNGTAHLDLLRWGLIPAWAKQEAIGSKMINARAETLAEKPSFKRLLRARRCLVVADGFYEWKQEQQGAKTPMYITLKNHEPFAFAGLWDDWKRPDGQQVRSCTIITTEPNELMLPIHNRMPVILPAAAREQWLDVDSDDEHMLLPLLTPYPADQMMARAVSRLVNNPRHDSVHLIA